MPDSDSDQAPADPHDGDEIGPESISVHVVVHGRVQGVFFRATTAEQAVLHGVTGWVRNRADGAVEAHLEGPRSSVDAMVAWCRIGSRHARVARVEVKSDRMSGDSTFEIRR